MFHIFIDTNVLIRFFSFTDDSLDEVEKFIALVEAKKITLYCTEQVMNEYIRNSESDLAKSLQELDSAKLPFSFPRFVDHYEEAVNLKKLVKDCQEAKNALVKKLRGDAADGNLRADKLVQKLLTVGKIISADAKIVELAKARRDRGNPPGKPSSLGDQINWEHLLRDVPSKCDLHFISRDADFSSKLDALRPSRFLVDEWKAAKTASLYLYPSLGHFAKKHFPEVKVPTDIIKSEAMSRLISSSSFSMTHSAIAKLETVFEEISAPDAIALLQAVIDNTQVKWVVEDDDAKAFFDKLYKKHFVKIPAKMDNELAEIADYFDLPF